MTESKSVALPLGEFPMIMERVKRIELSQPAWKAGALPLSYTREYWSGRRDSNSRPSPWQGDALPLSHFRTYEQNAKHFVSPDIGKQSFLGGAVLMPLHLVNVTEFPPGKPPSNYVAL